MMVEYDKANKIYVAHKSGKPYAQRMGQVWDRFSFKWESKPIHTGEMKFRDEYEYYHSPEAKAAMAYFDKCKSQAAAPTTTPPTGFVTIDAAKQIALDAVAAYVAANPPKGRKGIPATR